VLAYAAFPLGLFLPQYYLCAPMLGDPPSIPSEAIGTDIFDFELHLDLDHQDLKLRSIAAHGTQLPDGRPHALFPGNIVGAQLDVERYIIEAKGGENALLREQLGRLVSPSPA
jgi:hypothetical protein